jgi:ribosomal protein S18 acetylase RimI-like enzyme
LRELTREKVRGLVEERSDELVAVWPDIRGAPLEEIIRQHVEREGLRFVVEEDAEGRLAGLTYGYFGEPGQWWHDRVAAAMSGEQREHWLAPGHFELVELVVRPDLRGRGLGRRLHDAVLAGFDDRPALLSTDVDNERALTLYRSSGWETLVAEIDFGAGTGQLFCVLGRAPSAAAERVVA